MAEEFMDKESWIASRTDNPDKLGRDVWNREYEISRSIHDRETELPKGMEISDDITRKMVAEFISKQGLSTNLDDDIQFDTAKTLFHFVMNGDEWQSKSGYQTMLDIAAKTSQKIKKRLEQENATKNETKNGKSELKKTLTSGMTKGNRMVSKGKMSPVRRTGSEYGG